MFTVAMPSPPKTERLVAAGLLLASLLALPGATLAQEARGVVVSAPAELPVASGIVELLDSATTVVARTLSGSDGSFAVLAPHAGAYRIRVRRVGFRSTVSAPYAIGAGEVIQIRLQVAELPIELAPVVVLGQLECKADQGASSETAVVWEEARKALTLTALAKTQRRLAVTSRRYARDVTVRGMRISNEQSMVTTGDSSALFRTATAAVLARDGYIEQRDSSTVYFAPDADVLLDDVFASTHCFQLVPGPRGDPETIGLAFTPGANDTLAEVRGVLWLDRRTAALRSLTFGYANPPPGVPDDSLIGGRIDFSKLESGWWVVRSWELRIPLEVDGRKKLVISAGKAKWISAYKATRYRQVGGDLLEAKEMNGAPDH